MVELEPTWRRGGGMSMNEKPASPDTTTAAIVDWLLTQWEIARRCRREGAEARNSGYTTLACPYESNVDKAAWLEGWGA